MNNFESIIASSLSIDKKQVSATLELLKAGGTVPFIARYRKEATAGLDEVQIINIKSLQAELEEIESRRTFILKSIEEQGKLTSELKQKIENVLDINRLEDIYLPYKPKRKTRAVAAKEKGLEPLALLIFKQESNSIENETRSYVNCELGVNTNEEAIAGALDIIAEIISEDEKARTTLRNLFKNSATITSKVRSSKKAEGEKYKDYFDWSESLMKCPSHRLLAMRRGENEGFLSIDISPEIEESLNNLELLFLKNKNQCTALVKQAIEDSYKRLLKPSMETEYRVLTKKIADEAAINVFADNIRELLLAAPLGQKRMMAIDPGFRTGCKVVVLDEQGKLLEDSVIYPHTGQSGSIGAEQEVLRLATTYSIEAIAIGNGTAGRETETFIRSIKKLPETILIIMVNESGASIYSASDVAREEFPDKDITVRGAVSIGRRLADPLAELVKIDPKSIGVGQYQHDVDQQLLKKKLDEVVESSVNKVGVELNTASKELLTYVAGLGPTLANNIVKYRNEHGAFKTRKQLLKVPRMGEKAFEQCAGFLRIRNAKNPLDASAVHPESYTVVEAMAKDANCKLEDLINEKTIREKIDIKKYITEKIGEFTLKDILKELEKPGRDPRKEFEIFEFDNTVNTIKDLIVGMLLPGIVTNVTKFGAFVDIGVHQDGLVHISQLSDRFITDPSSIIKVGQTVMVRVTEIDIDRKRIALSRKGLTKG
ncbi:MAG: RNA-binding transcriptional accessory protein [Bacteroidetes bacterium RIFCSPLOWO2_12_FULL_35_15]|nr:MAG: RNA-binding transcriptional accessory protein [Bacteroidetes bacterium RIFCSPLOWO2_12_FULL_35_15]